MMSRMAELLVKAEDNPDNFEHWFDLGKFAIDRYVIGVGLEAMRKADSLSPNNPDVLDYLARALNRARELDEAADVYQRALKITNEMPGLWAGYAVVCSHLGNMGKSLECFRKAVEVDPGYAWGVFGYTTHLGLSPQRGQILPILKRAVEVNPDSGQLWMSLSNMMGLFGDPEGSRVALDEAVRRIANSPPDEHRRALSMMMRSERSDDAIRIAREIIKKDPDNLGVYGSVITWCADNDPEEGKKLLDYALKIDPNNSSIKPDGVILLTKAGDIPGALRILDTIKQEMPNSPVASALMATLAQEIDFDKLDEDSETSIPLSLEILYRTLNSSEELRDTFKLDELKEDLAKNHGMQESRHVIDELRGLYSTTVWHLYTRLVDKEGWPYVRKRMIESLRQVSPDEKFQAQFGVLDSLDLIEFAGYDGDVCELLKQIPEDRPFEDVGNLLYEMLIEEVSKQIKKDGPTLFLDVERLAHTKGVILIPHILEAKNKELEDARVYISETQVDLRDLWKTSIGFDILTALEMRLETDIYGLERIKQSLEGIGMKVSAVSISKKEFKEGMAEKQKTVKMSDEMQSFVYAHANRTLNE
ncbi:MAG: tetratricopeptide repeat protein [Candidatus Thorarchaeota archaeon]